MDLFLIYRFFKTVLRKCYMYCRERILYRKKEKDFFGMGRIVICGYSDDFEFEFRVFIL